MTIKVKYKFDKEQQRNWFPYSYSKDPDNFIIQNGVHGRCPNTTCKEDCQEDNKDYWKNFTEDDVVDKEIDIGCFGCSFTYGSFLSYENTWPALLQESLMKKTGNFGVPGGGVDACFINLKNCFKKHKIKTAIVLLSPFERRLCRFEKQGYYFQMPVGSHTDWPYDDNIANNFFDRSFIIQQIKNTNKEIIEDIDNNYSIEILNQLIHFCNVNNIKLYLSSWSSDVYKYLKNRFTNLLPFYNLNTVKERAGDGQHPCKGHNQIWVDNIKIKI